MDKKQKEKQLRIISKYNPCNDDYHAWIRDIEDIKTFEETLQDNDYIGYSRFAPDYNLEEAKEAQKNGKIRVYSSHPIQQGTFVTPSKLEAQSYSKSGFVYCRTVRLTDIAWIDVLQGQYANINIEKNKENNDKER